MARSLIKQLEQISNTATYNDAISNVHTSGVAEISVSGTLEHDLNVIRTLLKDISGTTNWYDDPGTSLTALSSAISDSSDDKIIETTATLIPKNIEHIIPGGKLYTPVSTAGEEGKNMDVYMAGQLLVADTGVGGVNADRDYGETSTSGITFRFDVQSGRNITYVIRK